jgi:hypothetical protein
MEANIAGRNQSPWPFVILHTNRPMLDSWGGLTFVRLFLQIFGAIRGTICIEPLALAELARTLGR